MTEIQVFSNEAFGEVRVTEVNGEPYMVGKDVASILGYKEPAKAIREHVDEEDKGVSVLDTPGGKQTMTIINESGLYSLILSSKLPQVKAFKRWVTSEVLPSIRKNGGYMVAKEDESDEDLMARALVVANEALKRRDERIKELQTNINEKNEQIIGLSAELIEKTKDSKQLTNLIKNNPSGRFFMSQIAADWGMTANKMNLILKDAGLIKRVGKHWQLTAKYLSGTKTYAVVKPIMSNHNPNKINHYELWWTMDGYDIIYKTMKKLGYSPINE